MNKLGITAQEKSKLKTLRKLIPSVLASRVKTNKNYIKTMKR
jgi:hypothetical protein